MKTIWTGILAGIGLIGLSTANSQSSLNVPKFQFGLSAGTFVYQGDLTPERLGAYKTLRPGISVFASKLLSSSVAIRVNMAFGGLRGNDAAYDNPPYRKQRAFNFRSPVIEASAMAEWNLLGRNYANRGLAPYIFGGGAISYIHVQRDYSHFQAEYFGVNSAVVTGLNADLQHATPRILLALPVGIGLRYYFSDRLGISAETTYRIMTNDYLDGFSQSADPVKGDHYYSHMIGIVYRLGKINAMDCPPVR